jgi:hypothetical protein
MWKVLPKKTEIPLPTSTNTNIVANNQIASPKTTNQNPLYEIKRTELRNR